MSHQAHNAHAAHKVWEMFDTMTPLDKKSPAVAFAVGFLFGALGLGLYFWNWKEFFLCLGIVVFVVVVMIPTAAFEAFSVPIAFFLTGVYGARRAATSNHRLHL